jgi:biopolymer transport protein ExbD
MRASRIHSRGPAHIEAQLTPLIDMAFLLIVFFVLVGQVASAEFVELSLPRTASDAPGRPGDAQRLVVNVVPARDGGAAAYRLGRREFGPDAAGLAELARTLADAIRAKPALEVNVRADRATAYSWVRPAMDAVSDALALSGADRARVRVRLVVLPAGGGDG